MFRRRKKIDAWHDHLPNRLPKDTGVPEFPVQPMAIFLTPLFVGLGLDFLTRWRLGGGLPRVWAGMAIVVAGYALSIWAMQQYRKAGSSPDIGHRPRSLVVSGPYRFTRNPLYLAMAIMVAGLSAALNLPWGILVLVLALIALDRLVVRREERYLSERFGEAYDRYHGRVRRWL
jgi:protein-S-isoprenylcysteine O-methyltransferase Ste14